jgi:hypothetical protein
MLSVVVNIYNNNNNNNNKIIIHAELRLYIYRKLGYIKGDIFVSGKGLGAKTERSQVIGARRVVGLSGVGCKLGDEL